MKKITQEWIQKAEGDHKVACRELETEPSVPEAACFHAQQCLEKYLKAILQENNVSFEKIHDLDLLAQRCKDFMPQLMDHRDELVRLSTYAVDVRYPGFEISFTEAKACVKIMEKIRKIIRGHLGL